MKAAADDKSPLAYTLLARLYEHGQGVTQDINQATRYYILAAKEGEPIAKKVLEKRNK